MHVPGAHVLSTARSVTWLAAPRLPVARGASHPYTAPPGFATGERARPFTRSLESPMARGTPILWTSRPYRGSVTVAVTARRSMGQPLRARRVCQTRDGGWASCYRSIAICAEQCLATGQPALARHEPMATPRDTASVAHKEVNRRANSVSGCTRRRDGALGPGEDLAAAAGSTTKVVTGKQLKNARARHSWHAWRRACTSFPATSQTADSSRGDSQTSRDASRMSKPRAV